MDLPVRRDTGEAITEVLDRRLVILVLGGILCLGMALGLELFPHMSARDLTTARLAPSEGRGGESIMLPEPPAARGLITVAELMQILSPRRSDPVAQKFSQAFMSNAGLKSIYDQFASGTGSRPASEFVAALQRSPDFGDLVRSNSKDPAFRSMAEILTRHPELNRLLRQMSPPGASTSIAGPKFAPLGRGADTIDAEARGRLSPVGDIKAPGKPMPQDDRR